MAGGGDKSASFPIVLDNQVSLPASAAAGALEALRAKVEGGQASLKDMNATLRSLKGSSDDVKGAKDALRAKIAAEANAVSKANLELLKAGTSYTKVAEDAKKLAEQKKRLEEESKKLTEAQKRETEGEKASAAALKATGGPIGALKGHVEELGEIFRSGGSAAGAFTLALGGLTAAAVAAGAAAGAGALAFGKWVIEGANVERTLRLQREAMIGDAESAKNLGDQIALTASRVSVGREKLDDLAKSLTRTRLTGQEQVDTMNLVAQAADGMGDDVGNAFKSIATRGAMFQRLQISPAELLGTGVDFNDVAGDLAKAMGVSTDKAKQALFSGQVKLDAGLQSLRKTIDKRFAEINAKKALDINVQVTRMRENFQRLTRDVNLEPLAKGVKIIADNFDESTVTGSALHDVVTRVGDVISETFGEKAPLVHKFVQGVEIAGLTFAISLLKMRKSFNDTFGSVDTSGIDLVKTSMTAGTIAAGFFGGALLNVREALALTKGVAEALDISKPLLNGYHAIRDLDWKGLGADIVKGILGGLAAGPSLVADAVTKIGTAAKDEFKSALGIHSPSKVFAEYGESTAEGYSKGVERSLPSVQGSVDKLAGPAPSSGSTGAGGGRSVGKIELHVHVGGGGGAGNVKADVERATEPLLAQLTKILEDAMATGAAGASEAA